jgi:hypothetical protein
MQISGVIALIVTIFLAAIGYVATYTMNLRLARRKDRLERINRQLSELYGPLNALNMAAMRAWTELQQRHALWGTDVYFTEAEADAMPPFTATAAETWRLWMTHVFMPLNRRMVEIVVNHADLLIEKNIPQCLQDLTRSFPATASSQLRRARLGHRVQLQGHPLFASGQRRLGLPWACLLWLWILGGWTGLAKVLSTDFGWAVAHPGRVRYGIKHVFD